MYMNAYTLYQRLEKDFIVAGMYDEWMEDMEPIVDFLSENFTKRSMGLVCDFTSKIQKVYSAVFPSRGVMQKILDDGTEDAMLFVHHPAVWDIRNAPKVFTSMDRDLLQQFRKRNIAVYNLHVPLDHYHSYGTSYTLALALGLRGERPFARYFGALAGVFAQADVTTVDELKERFRATVGHEVSLYQYGERNIVDGVVGVIAGGGNDRQMLKEIAQEGVNTLIAGVTVKNDHSLKAHEYAKKQRINILGGTHYSTEKFACMEMVRYFQQCGVAAEFVQDTPIMEDL